MESLRDESLLTVVESHRYNVLTAHHG
jgi:hypothetical protein